jgi:predicted O-linked N-acetylglucosamine transferase (SPINDLY family)
MQVSIEQALEVARQHEAAGRLAEAAEVYRKILSLDPRLPRVHLTLGNLLQKMGRFDDAIASFQNAARLSPEDGGIFYNMGNALILSGRAQEAIAAYRQSIQFKPDFAAAHNNLGKALRDSGKFAEAVISLREAIRLNPELASAHCNLGGALTNLDEIDEAVVECRRAIALAPTYAEAHNMLGIALMARGRFDEAIEAFEQAIRLNPAFADAHNNLGTACKDTGRLDAAIHSYRRANELQPGTIAIQSNLLHTLHYHPGFGRQEINAELMQWNQRYAQPLRKFIRPHTNDRNPDRPLRIGYLGAYFRDHCQSFFTIPLLSRHDPAEVEAYCYSQVSRPDAVTDRIRGLVREMRSIVGVSSANAAEMIRSDRIDILVDLTMHMGECRPLIFARKPAPVQAAWLAYPGSTGMAAMDYRLTDPYLDPPEADDVYSEKSIRLRDTFWCYDPLSPPVDPGPLPAIANQCVTFGSLNNFCKVNDGTLQRWALVLKGAGRSRLMFLCAEGSHRNSVLDVFAREGIDSTRIDLVAPRSRKAYLELYRQIDIGLDTLPYNGHTTSLDSFWMGVPVVTTVGNTVVGRGGLSQLTNLKLTELIADSPQQFVKIAAGLAADLPRLAELRAGLRRRMETSPLMDAGAFARAMESAYRQMWQTWCARARD